MNSRYFIPVFLSLFAVASAADLTHIPDKDFDTLHAAGRATGDAKLGPVRTKNVLGKEASPS